MTEKLIEDLMTWDQEKEDIWKKKEKLRALKIEVIRVER